MSLNLERRALLGGIALAGAGAGLPARAKAGAPLSIATMPLWTKAPPGGVPAGLAEQEVPRSPTGPADDTAFLHVTSPMLMHCRPSRPNGAAVLLVPGGGYVRVAIGHGGKELLRRFADAGYHAFLLKYRLPGDAWAAGADAPLQDAQRALRLVRTLATGEGFDPARVALWGGSAGGHLAARLANTADPAYSPADAIDAQPLGVRAAILLYPVNLMAGPFVHAPSRQALSGPRAVLPAEGLAAEAGLSPTSPPTFLAHALDDTVVPVENALSYFAAMRRAGTAGEFHVQESGGHGFGWTRADGSVWGWPQQALDFIRRHGA